MDGWSEFGIVDHKRSRVETYFEASIQVRAHDYLDDGELDAVAFGDPDDDAEFWVGAFQRTWKETAAQVIGDVISKGLSDGTRDVQVRINITGAPRSYPALGDG